MDNKLKTPLIQILFIFVNFVSVLFLLYRPSNWKSLMKSKINTTRGMLDGPHPICHS